MLLKKEVNKTHTEGDSDESGNYRQVVTTIFATNCLHIDLTIQVLSKDVCSLSVSRNVAKMLSHLLECVSCFYYTQSGCFGCFC